MNLQTFEQWMNEVDRCLIKLYETTSADLSDYHYYDLYEDGVCPEEAADEAFEHALYS